MRNWKRKRGGLRYAFDIKSGKVTYEIGVNAERSPEKDTSPISFLSGLKCENRKPIRKLSKAVFRGKPWEIIPHKRCCAWPQMLR